MLSLGTAVIQSASHQTQAALGHCDCDRTWKVCSFQLLGFVVHHKKHNITKESSLMDPKGKELQNLST